MSPTPSPNPLKAYLIIAGLTIRGDVGPYTCWTSKAGRIVVATKNPPDEPPSPLQQKQRARFGAAMDRWSHQTPSARQAWNTAATANSLPMSGVNLFIQFSFTQNLDALASINRIARTTLTLPDPLPL